MPLWIVKNLMQYFYFIGHNVTVSSKLIDYLIEMSTELPPILFDIELDYTK